MFVQTSVCQVHCADSITIKKRLFSLQTNIFVIKLNLYIFTVFDWINLNSSIKEKIIPNGLRIGRTRLTGGYSLSSMFSQNADNTRTFSTPITFQTPWTQALRLNPEINILVFKFLKKIEIAQYPLELLKCDERPSLSNVLIRSIKKKNK